MAIRLTRLPPRKKTVRYLVAELAWRLTVSFEVGLVVQGVVPLLLLLWSWEKGISAPEVPGLSFSDTLVDSGKLELWVQLTSLKLDPL